MILISVPHAQPHKDVERNEIGMPLKKTMHFCDWISEYSARMLHAMIPNSILVINETNRRFLDGNRRESRNTPFRKNLQKIMASTDISLLIDMHSANENFFGNADVTLVCQEMRAWADYQVSAWTKGKATLRTPNFLSPYEYEFIDALRAENISVNIASAWPATLDIVEHAKTMNVPGILLEMNEETLTTPADIERVISAIAKWANRIE
jgi:hypothetical protein